MYYSRRAKTQPQPQRASRVAHMNKEEALGAWQGTTKRTGSVAKCSGEGMSSAVAQQGARNG
ncbi:MAG TPA: hypothetical protein PKD90_12480 [Phnomibacter sp.]|nr:hypothetical protein [Phnomibacter sp.]